MSNATAVENGHPQKGYDERIEEVALEVADAALAPRNQRADARKQKQGEAQRHVDLIEERRCHTDLDAPKRLRDDRKQGAPEHREHDADQEQVVEQKAAFARQDGLQAMVAAQLRQAPHQQGYGNRQRNRQVDQEIRAQG